MAKTITINNVNSSVSSKEARRLFTKFLMENNCLIEYIACYRYYNKLPKDLYPPSWIIDDVIDKLIRKRRPIGYAIENVGISFEWVKCQQIMCNMHSLTSLNNDNYAYDYWSSLSRKLYKYSNIYVHD